MNRSERDAQSTGAIVTLADGTPDRSPLRSGVHTGPGTVIWQLSRVNVGRLRGPLWRAATECAHGRTRTGKRRR